MLITPLHRLDSQGMQKCNMQPFLLCTANSVSLYQAHSAPSQIHSTQGHARKSKLVLHIFTYPVSKLGGQVLQQLVPLVYMSHTHSCAPARKRWSSELLQLLILLEMLLYSMHLIRTQQLVVELLARLGQVDGCIHESDRLQGIYMT